MGLFHKKDKRSEMEKAIAASGSSINNGQVTKDQQKVDFATAQQNARKKDLIADQLMDLYKICIQRQNEQTAEFVDEVRDLAQFFKGTSQANDNDSVMAIDSMILEMIGQIKNYVTRGDFGSLISANGMLKELMFDRENAAPYYKDPKYYQAARVHMAESLNLANENSKLEGLREQARKMKAQVQANPQLAKRLQSQFQMTVAEIKRREEDIHRLETRVQNAQLAAESIKQNIDVKIGEMSLDDTMLDAAIESRAEAAAKNKMQDKYNEKLSQHYGSVSNNAMGLDGVSTTQETQEDAVASFDIDI